MAGFRNYDVPVECPNCGTRHDFKTVRFTILWANQYGGCIRIFCYGCGQWTDRTQTASKGVVDRVVRPPREAV